MGIQVFCWAGKFPIFHSKSWASKLPVEQVSQKNFTPSWAPKTCDTVFCTEKMFSSDTKIGWTFLTEHYRCIKLPQYTGVEINSFAGSPIASPNMVLASRASE